MKISSRAFVPMLIVLLHASVLQGQVRHASERKLAVGTKDSPPFAIKNEDGTWSGISVELWQRIARELDVGYEFLEFDLQGLLDGVGSGSLDVCVGALTVTPEREQAFDFSHPFYSTGLSIAAASKGKKNWVKAVGRVFSRQFLGVVTTLALLLLGIGLLVWLLERKRNPGHFGGKALSGIGSGFWWSAVTMTTVGYGDKAPVTLSGRILAMVWMFAGIIAISSFTAAITSTLTLTQLESKVSGPEDLLRVAVGTVPGSTSASYLSRAGISFRGYPTPADGLRGVVRGELDAFVYDAPILRYLAIKQFSGAVQVLPKTFERQDYALALSPDSSLREAVNQGLLRLIQTDAWQDVLRSYLGQ